MKLPVQATPIQRNINTNLVSKEQGLQAQCIQPSGAAEDAAAIIGAILNPVAQVGAGLLGGLI